MKGVSEAHLPDLVGKSCDSSLFQRIKTAGSVEFGNKADSVILYDLNGPMSKHLVQISRAVILAKRKVMMGQVLIELQQAVFLLGDDEDE